MKTPCKSIRLLSKLIVVLTNLFAISLAAGKEPVPVLSKQGKVLEKEYAGELDAIQKEIIAALPAIDADKKAAFETARTELGALKAPAEDAGQASHKAYQTAKPLAEAKALESARPLLADLKPLLTSDALDGKLMKAAILRHGTPAGLAEFAQKSEVHKALLDQLFADEKLRKFYFYISL